MLERLKERVYEANMLLHEHNLVVLTWGNVSELDAETGIMAIKPSGVSYASLTSDMMVLVDVKSGKKLEGKLNPSSDTATHCELYRAFEGIGGITHTHSRWATVFAQAGRGIPPLGTTHADYFHGEIPCTREMTAEEIAGDYEAETGKVIAETLSRRVLTDTPLATPAALVRSHGPFTWGKNAAEAVHNAVVLEEIAFMAWQNLLLDSDISPMQKELMDRHFFRKHGENAYYGQ